MKSLQLKKAGYGGDHFRLLRRCSSILKGLAHFNHAKHDVVIFQIWDPDELEFPFRSWTRFDCLENLGLKHTIDPVHLREAYLENLREYREELVKGCHRHRVQLFPMTTDEPYSEGLASFLAARSKAGFPYICEFFNGSFSTWGSNRPGPSGHSFIQPESF